MLRKAGWLPEQPGLAGSSVGAKSLPQRRTQQAAETMELASAHLLRVQIPWRGLLLTGKETFLEVESRGAQRLDGVFWERKGT